MWINNKVLSFLTHNRTAGHGILMSDYTGSMFKCRYCGQEFHTKEEANAHYETAHSIEKGKLHIT
jgi:hypothetical protein